MHIAIATAEFVTEKEFAGGLANYTANLARILKQHGHKVSILVPSSEEGKTLWESEITVYRIRYIHGGDKKGIPLLRYVFEGLSVYFGKSFFINRKIREINKIMPIDIVHFSSSDSLALFRNKKIPAAVRISTYFPMMRQANVDKFDVEKCSDKLTLQEMIQLFSIKRADNIFAPSYLTAKLVEKKIGRKVKVIESPCLIDTSKIDDSLYLEKLANKKYFLFYGTLGYLKGVHTIAGILENLFDENPEYYFVFVGNTSNMLLNGEKIDAMEYIRYTISKKYLERVIYIPAIENKSQLYSIIKHAQACILPSRFDNLPNTCIESMALGQVVIGTKGASFEQLIEDGKSGYLVEIENALQLYEKIKLVIGLSKEERSYIGENSKKVIERLRPDSIYIAIIKLYNETIRKYEEV